MVVSLDVGVQTMALFGLKTRKLIEWRDHLEDFINLHAPLTVRKYKGILQEFETFLQKPMIDCTESDSLAYANEALKQKGRVGDTVSKSHIRSKLSIISNLFENLKDGDFIQRNPAKAALKLLGKAQSGELRPSGVVSADEINKLMGGQGSGLIAIRNVAILSLLFGAGLRPREMLMIKIGDIKRTEKGTYYIHLPTTKAQRAADQGLQTWVADAVLKLWNERKRETTSENDPLITAYYTDGRSYNTFADYATFRYWWQRMLKNAGLSKKITPHWGRCTAINKLISMHVPHDRIKEFSRHSSVAMVEYYERRRIDLDDLPQKDLKYGK